VQIKLTLQGCPMHTGILCGITAAVTLAASGKSANIALDVMAGDERDALKAWLKDGKPGPANVSAGPVPLT
jgi:ATP-binding protein involved in chromosome partitioning